MNNKLTQVMDDIGRNQEAELDRRKNLAAATGAYICTRCGFVGFWYGGPHCGPGSEPDPKIRNEVPAKWPTAKEQAR